MIALALPAHAQIGSGNIRGKVLDREGKPLQGAIIRAEHLTTHQTEDAKSARSGDYSITGLFQGTYKVYLIVDNKLVMVKGEGVGNAIQVADGIDSNVSFDMRTAPAAPIANTAPAAAPKDDKEREAQKKAIEETKAAFTAGVAAANAKNYEEAAKQFQLAAEKDPGQPSVFANLGVALSNLKKYNEAAEAFRKSVELKGDDATVRSRLSFALAESGKFDEANQEVQEVAKLDPAIGGQSYFNLGAVLSNRGRSKEAVEAFNKAITIDPKNAEAYYQLGIAYFGSTDTIGQAVTALEKYLQLQPSGANAEAAKQLIAAAKAQAPAASSTPQQKKN
jgi:tetratricopeptide (TPR) repeat protein